MMRGIVAKLKAAASVDQVTKATTEQQDEAIYAYVDALPELQRTILLMRLRDGQTYVEIAEALGLGRKVFLNRSRRCIPNCA